MSKKVTPEDLAMKHREFVDAYLADPNMNATRAYMSVFPGSSEEAARRSASRLLTRADVSRALAEAMRSRSERMQIDADWVLKNLVEVAQRCMQKAPVMVYDRKAGEMVQAVDEEERNLWQFDSKGANTALQLIGKHVDVAAFEDRVSVSTPRPITFNLTRKVEGK